MAEKQVKPAEESSIKEGDQPQTTPEAKRVEVAVQGEEKTVSAVPPPTKHDDSAQVISAIMEVLCFDCTGKTEQDLCMHNSQLKSLLGKVIELLKEKTDLCSNLEKQNTALTLQSSSLKDVVAITKDLLSIRNMEVEHLHVDIKSMEEKINAERERHNNMLNRMSEAVKLNENLKVEYQTQLGLFNDLRGRYEEKVALLENENKRLSALAKGGDPSTEQPSEKTGEGEGVQLSLQKITPS